MKGTFILLTTVAALFIFIIVWFIFRSGKKHLKIGIITIFVVILAVFIYFQNNYLVVTKINVTADIDSSLKIVHLSDLHCKQFGNGNVWLTQKIINISPDIIIFTGDIIDAHHNTKNIEPTIAFIKDIGKASPIPVICIMGNHEWNAHLQDEVTQKLQGAGVIVLRNELITIETLCHTGQTKGNTVSILGLDETKGPYRDLFDELAQMQGYRIVLSHYPENFALAGEGSYSQYDFDLMFAGHAHGGQFNLPFIGGVISPGQGFNPRYYKGIYDDRLIVSRGLGNSGFPLRLFNYPEIVEVVIE
jgi:predicted MPP superfamily phosphohydrolase